MSAPFAEIEALSAYLESEDDQRFVPHAPTAKQREFLALTCLEALYGGAAGGGKSDALLMAALQYVHVKGYAALLLRRTYSDLSLPGAIMDRAKTWLIPKGVNWNEKEKRFTFPSGATLTFGYLDTERDRFRYQGAELQFIGVDELTQLPEQWYRYLLSRLRRLHDASIPLRARAASNPGGIGHDWVRRRFVDATRGDRKFVPATLRDNPHLDADTYERSLAQLDATTRAQLLEGTWIRDSGGLVYARFDESRNVVPKASTPKLTTFLLGIDYGFVDATAFAILGWRDDDPTVYVVRAFKREKLTPSQAGELVKDLEATYSFCKIVGDVGGLGKGYAEEARVRFSLPIEAAEKNNKRGYIDLLNGDLERGRVKLVAGACDELVAEWLELPWDDARAKESEGFENHCSDAALYAWRACSAYHNAPPVEGPKRGTREALEAEAQRLEAAAVASLEPNEEREFWETM